MLLWWPPPLSYHLLPITSLVQTSSRLEISLLRRRGAQPNPNRQRQVESDARKSSLIRGKSMSWALSLSFRKQPRAYWNRKKEKDEQFLKCYFPTLGNVVKGLDVPFNVIGGSEAAIRRGTFSFLFEVNFWLASSSSSTFPPFNLCWVALWFSFCCKAPRSQLAVFGVSKVGGLHQSAAEREWIKNEDEKKWKFSGRTTFSPLYLIVSVLLFVAIMAAGHCDGYIVVVVP